MVCLLNVLKPFKFFVTVPVISVHYKKNPFWNRAGVFGCRVTFIIYWLFVIQVSAIEQDIIEVDPDTKEMLKVLVSLVHFPQKLLKWTLIFQKWHLLLASPYVLLLTIFFKGCISALFIQKYCTFPSNKHFLQMSTSFRSKNIVMIINS